jgi:hypothetical protein
MTDFVRTRRFRFLAIVTLVSAGTLSAASFSPASANFFYSAGSTYEESKNKTTCGTNTSCAVMFRKVPAGKTLMITHVSCRVVANGTAPITNASLGDTDQTRAEFLTPVQLSTDGENFRYFHLSNEVSTIFTAATTPEVSVTFDGSILMSQLSCNIAGQYL